MWLVCFAVLFVVLLYVAWKYGPNRAAGCTALLALLVPIWVQVDFFGQPLDVRVASGIAALSVYCVHRKSTFRTPLVLVDYAAIALVTVHLVSDWHNDGFSVFVPLRAYGEWAVPYLLGRVAIQSCQDARALVPVAVVVISLLAICALIETISRTNPFETIFGIRTVETATRGWHRLGLGRASGTTRNPIYFGTLQLLLFPWAIYAVASAFRRTGLRWSLIHPLSSVVGVCCTISRAPTIGLFIVLPVTALIKAPRSRPFLISIAMLGAVLLTLNYQAVLHGLHQWSGEPTAKYYKPITVGDKKVEYSGTLHRLHLFKAYSTAMRRAGFFGFGTERTTGFPVRVPMGRIEAETLKRLWSVDNTYILLVLRFGYLGVAAFCVMAASAAISYSLVARKQESADGVFAASMAGAILAAMFIMLTVWMPHDYGFWFMWTVGSAAGLRSHT